MPTRKSDGNGLMISSGALTQRENCDWHVFASAEAAESGELDTLLNEKEMTT
jgi:hypothetical protein